MLRLLLFLKEGLVTILDMIRIDLKHKKISNFLRLISDFEDLRVIKTLIWFIINRARGFKNQAIR